MTDTIHDNEDVRAMQLIEGPPPLPSLRSPNSSFENLVLTVADAIGKKLQDFAAMLLRGAQNLGKLGIKPIIGLGIGLAAILTTVHLITRGGSSTGLKTALATHATNGQTISQGQAADEEKQMNADLARGTNVLQAIGAPAASIQTSRDLIAFTRESEIATQTAPVNASSMNSGRPLARVVSSYVPAHYASLHGLNMTKYRETLSTNPSMTTIADNSVVVHDGQIP